MATTVEIGVYLTTADAPYFRIGNAVKGRLNNASYRLAGPIFYDITDKVRSVSTKRGKNRELDRYSAGNATVSLNNEDRSFDPLNTASIFYGNIIPRRQIRIRSGGYDQFNGVIEDWNLDYDVSGKSNAEIVAADGFALLAQQTLTPGTATVEKTGARINAVLDQPTVAWPTNQRSIDEGNNTVGADVFDGNVLSYLQDVENSEQGQLFIDRVGNVRFVNGAATPTSGSNVLVSTNLVTNPSMEATSGYTTVRTNLATNVLNGANSTNISATRMTLSLQSGFVRGTITDATANSMAQRFAPSAVNTGAAVTAGQTYTMSAYGRTSAAAALMGVQILWYQADGTTLVSGTNITSTAVNSSTFTRMSVTATAPANAAYAYWYVGISGTGARAINDTVDAYGLLIESSSTLGDYFDGSFSPAGDFSYAWTGTANASTSIQRGAGVEGNSTQGPAAAIQSGDWFSSGTKSIRLIPTTSANNNRARFTIPTTVGVTYTAKAKIRLSASQTGALNGFSRTIRVTNLAGTQLAISSQSPNAAGVYELSVSFTATETSTRVELWLGASAGNGDVWWDDLIVVEGAYTGDYFDGSTTDSMPYSYRWTGLENASTSVKELSTLPLFSDADDGIPYTSIAVSYGTELLFNQASVTSPAGTAIANNTVSQGKYGITQTTVNTLLSNTTDTSNLAAFTVAKYGEPEYRFENLEIALNGLTGTQKNQVLQLELGDIIQVKFTPNKVGSSIQRYGQIISINNSIGPSEHKIVYGVGSVQYAFLVLDDVGFGILDTNALAF